jgi:outer membrane protein OmpA-like peptidoglycan-associated protein
MLPVYLAGMVFIVILLAGYFLFFNHSEKESATVDNNEKAKVSATEQPVITDEQATRETTNPADTGTNASSAVTTSPKASASSTKANFPYKKGETYKVYQFPFGVGEYTEPDAELDKLVEVLKNNPTVKIAISAYTDSKGSAEFNQSLSDKRAKAILNYLVSKGIAPERLSCQGKGISTKFTDDAENRRAEFVMTE